MLTARENQLGRDVTDRVPAADGVAGIRALSPHHDRIWHLAAEHLRVRSNDGHTVYAYGLAHALVDLHPEADPEVVLPAILLHDTGWSCAPEGEVLDAIAPGGGRGDLVLLHEREGARIAREVRRHRRPTGTADAGGGARTRPAGTRSSACPSRT